MKISRGTVQDIQRLYREQIAKTRESGGGEFKKAIEGAAGKPAGPAAVFHPPSGVNPLNPVLTGRPVDAAKIDPTAVARFATEVVAAQPEVRTERVDAIKALIDQGRYNVPATAIADRMLAGTFLLQSWDE